MITDKKKLINNLASIKRVLENNNSIYKFYPLKYVRLALIIAGSAIILFCGIFHVLNRFYHGFSNYPLYLKIIFVVLAAAVLLLIFAFKIMYILKRKKEKQGRYKPADETVKSPHIFNILLTVIPGLIFTGVIAYIFIINGLTRYLTGTIVSGISLFSIFASRFLNFKDLFYFGIYVFSWGITALVLLYHTPLLIIGSSFGLGCLAWGVYLHKFKSVYLMK